MTTKTWDGTTNDWYNDNGADWSPAGDPAATDQVIIDSGEAYLNSGDAGFTVASITLSSSGVLAIADPGVTQAVTGKFVNSGGFYVDTASGLGGSTVTIGGTLTNSGTLQIGPSDFSLSSPDQVTASHLNNTGTIALYGSGNGAPLEQATLDITSGAAPATLTGQVFIQGDALLEYASGKITSIGSGAELYLKRNRRPRSRRFGYDEQQRSHPTRQQCRRLRAVQWGGGQHDHRPGEQRQHLCGPKRLGGAP